jgi:uncharacterized protein
VRRIGRLRRGLALALGLFAAAPALADDAPRCAGKDLSEVAGLAEAKTKHADDLLNADGLLWRVEKPGVPVSYLFGTIHSTDEGAIALARRAAAETFDKVKVVATELAPMDAGAVADVAATALDRDHDTFDAAPSVDRAALEKLVTGLGYPPEFAHHLKLWFLAILVSTPACESRREALALPEVDALLAETAKESGLRVAALETAGEQIGAIASTSPEVSAALLAVAARDPGLNDDIYATMLSLYRQSRPADIVPIGDIVGDISPAERAAEDEFTRRLLVGRNAVMIERAGPLLQEGAFIAVGALHLAGKDGLIERLRREGYGVTRMW